ncbi:Hint domain-containing protein [Phaeobacter sp. 22II1-1F12B]|uniref:Hint domain-containing protein n=1 Tax=Phaeobacter sp. 22II1-1F12B TaxID=1317111 RepID=UPI0011872B43|nr:Hint domain-containing protein [Phaeobacter sp. 22II1-1F12B]
MALTSIMVAPYWGSLLTTQLLSGQQTLFFSAFGPLEVGVLDDDDGILSDRDDGFTTYNGMPIDFLGAGTATPGVDILGTVIPMGETVPIMLFEAGGTIYFDAPAGIPDFTGSIAVVIDLTNDPFTLMAPVCFAAGTRIRTPAGERVVEDIMPGETVLDWFGEEQRIIWAGERRFRLAERAWFDKWHPVRIARDAMGPGRPCRDTWVSQQHRIYLDQPIVPLVTGVRAGLAPARTLLNAVDIQIDRSLEEIRYCHLLCEEHAVLVANGMPAESLLLTSKSAEVMAEIAKGETAHVKRGAGPGLQELLDRRGQDMYLAAPEFHHFEARLVSAGMRAPVTGRGQVAA